ncbi:hypothetical protein [Dyella tabacisoli]|uniref:Uncharacterized protein n=1 Tax=Dyella tabacisoli TaxID=2282381 RepID=A0A369ULZ5_9GAMM|nr:hypothetical protein [Dyella tabacisoli]RDD81527.1 hypothetical protein DVJ77_10120 [Dyella tabacisoli]
MKIRTAACAVLSLVCLPTMAWCKQSTAGLPIAVEAIGIEKSDHRFYLDMRVWNCSSKELTMDIVNLPWGGMLANRLLIYQAYSGETMQAQYPIEDFPETLYVIPGGGYVSGQIDLGSYFPGLLKVKEPRNWVIFWLYQPFGSKGVPVGRRFGGMIPLDPAPSASPGTDACHAEVSRHGAHQ